MKNTELSSGDRQPSSHHVSNVSEFVLRLALFVWRCIDLYLLMMMGYICSCARLPINVKWVSISSVCFCTKQSAPWFVCCVCVWLHMYIASAISQPTEHVYMVKHHAEIVGAHQVCNYVELHDQPNRTLASCSSAGVYGERSCGEEYTRTRQRRRRRRYMMLMMMTIYKYTRA